MSLCMAALVPPARRSGLRLEFVQQFHTDDFTSPFATGGRPIEAMHFQQDRPASSTVGRTPDAGDGRQRVISQTMGFGRRNAMVAGLKVAKAHIEGAAIRLRPSF